MFKPGGRGTARENRELKDALEQVIDRDAPWNFHRSRAHPIIRFDGEKRPSGGGREEAHSPIADPPPPLDSTVDVSPCSTANDHRSDGADVSGPTCAFGLHLFEFVFAQTGSWMYD